MTEDFASRTWADHHKSFARNIADAAHAVATAFERLNALQFDAPWERVSNKSKCAN